MCTKGNFELACNPVLTDLICNCVQKSLSELRNNGIAFPVSTTSRKRQVSSQTLFSSVTFLPSFFSASSTGAVIFTLFKTSVMFPLLDDKFMVATPIVGAREPTEGSCDQEMCISINYELQNEVSAIFRCIIGLLLCCCFPHSTTM